MFKVAFLFLGLAIEAFIMHNAFARWFSLEEPISFIATLVDSQINDGPNSVFACI